MRNEKIHYDVYLHNPEEHIYRVRMHIADCRFKSYQLTMPAWIPGSYMIRDFAKNIITISARTAKGSVRIDCIDKQNWILECGEQDVVIEYDIYAWDCSVRTAHFDNTHAYFNGTSLFLTPVNLQDIPVSLEIHKPDRAYAKEWRVATSMNPITGKWQFGRYQADDYADLIDHPFEIGCFDVVSFEVANVPHDLVVSGNYKADLQAIVVDLEKICSQHVSMFGAMPADRYMFLVWVVDNGYGGLEHKYSTSLLVSHDDLIRQVNGKQTVAYRQFLGLCSHEYFHLWNVKRIKPAVFKNTDLSAEVYTRLLWVFEGFTSYYDDLALVRSGCISINDYLELLAHTMTRVRKGKGRLLQSISESSFYTWTKFYKQDENAANAIVSYYAKGILVSLCLDMFIRSKTNKTLDDVLRYMWVNYGTTDKGLAENVMPTILKQVTGISFDAFIDDYVDGTTELPLAEVLKTVDLMLVFDRPIKKDDKGGLLNTDAECTDNYIDLGVQFKKVESGLQVLTVSSGSAAATSGIAKGDVLVAIDRRKLSEDILASLSKYYADGDSINISYFRDNFLYDTNLILKNPPLNVARISGVNNRSEHRSQWLGNV